MLDFVRIACAVPPVKVGDVKKNAADICGYIEKADLQKADIVLFPELALTAIPAATCSSRIPCTTPLRTALHGF